MRQLNGALLALTVAPMAIVLAQPSLASAASPAACADAQTAVTTTGPHAAINGTDRQRICASAATPGLAPRSSKDSGHLSAWYHHVRAGSGKQLAAEASADGALGASSGAAPEAPLTGSDPARSRPPGGPHNPADPSCAEALAPRSNSNSADAGAGTAGQEASDNAAATCANNPSRHDPDSRYDVRSEPVRQSTGSAEADPQSESSALRLPYAGTNAVTALAITLGMTGGGLVLVVASARRRGRTS